MRFEGGTHKGNSFYRTFWFHGLIPQQWYVHARNAVENYFLYCNLLLNSISLSNICSTIENSKHPVKNIGKANGTHPFALYRQLNLDFHVLGPVTEDYMHSPKLGYDDPWTVDAFPSKGRAYSQIACLRFST